MKVRVNYVSNSSSSSFIVKQDLSNIGITCMKLSDDQLKLIDGYKAWEDDDAFVFEKNQEYYLTEYVSDCTDKYNKLTNNADYFFEYSNGGHYGPYEEEEFNEYKTVFASVWLYKSHDPAKQMSFKKFVKEFKENYFESDVIVKYEEETIILKVVR